MAPPAIQGLSTFGGFQFEVLDGSGRDIANLANVTYQMMGARQCAGQQGHEPVQQFHGERSAAGRGDRSRSRAQSRAADSRDHRRAVGVARDRSYVNDFDFNNRAYRVYVQADQRFRAQPEQPAAVLRARVRTARWCRSTRSCG